MTSNLLPPDGEPIGHQVPGDPPAPVVPPGPPSGSVQNGVIQSVIGPGTGRGIPEASEITLEHDDGSLLHAVMPTPRGDRLTAKMLTHRAAFIDFGFCPICLEPEARSREHVPPKSVGGSVLTMTCTPCNNEFGSKYEPSLMAWYDRSIGRAYFTGGAVEGRRRGGDVLLRQTADGTPVLIENGSSHPETDRILRGGGARMVVVPPDPQAAHVAAVKSAYLAACSFLKGIPNTPQAVALREELVRARDRRRDAAWEISPVLQNIKVMASDAMPEAGEIRLVQMLELDGSRTLAISFNRAFAVEWPLDEMLGGLVVPQYV